LVANAGLLAIAAYHMSTERGDLTWQGYALLTLFVVNFAYLLGHKGSDLGRIFRLIGLCSTPRKANCASVQIDFDKRSECANTLTCTHAA
jgi:hypothetical protein